MIFKLRDVWFTLIQTSNICILFEFGIWIVTKQGMNSAPLDSIFISQREKENVEYRRELSRELRRCPWPCFQDRQVLDLHVHHSPLHVPPFHRRASLGRTRTWMQHWHARLCPTLWKQILAAESNFSLGNAASGDDYSNRLFRHVLKLESGQGQIGDSEERWWLQKPPKVNLNRSLPKIYRNFRRQAYLTKLEKRKEHLKDVEDDLIQDKVQFYKLRHRPQARAKREEEEKLLLEREDKYFSKRKMFISPVSAFSATFSNNGRRRNGRERCQHRHWFRIRRCSCYQPVLPDAVFLVLLRSHGSNGDRDLFLLLLLHALLP